MSLSAISNINKPQLPTSMPGGVRFGNDAKPADQASGNQSDKPSSTAASEGQDTFVSPAAPKKAETDQTTESVKPFESVNKPAEGQTDESKPKAPEKPKEAEGWSVWSVAKNVGLFALSTFVLPAAIAAAPGMAFGAAAILACALPFLASRVNPQFKDGKLINESEVVKTGRKELKRLFKVLATPLKMVPNALIWAVTLPFQLPLLNRLGIPNSKMGLFKMLVATKQLVAKQIPLLFAHPRLQGFATGFPSTTWGKVQFGMKIAGLLLFVAFESRLAKLGWLGKGVSWLFSWFVSPDMVKSVKDLAQDLGKAGQTDKAGQP